MSVLVNGVHVVMDWRPVQLYSCLLLSDLSNSTPPPPPPFEKVGIL